MGELFLRLLGASPPEGGGRVTGASFGLQPAVPPALVVVAFLLLAALSFFVYTKTPRDVRRPRRLIMAALRTLLFGLILLLLLRPTLNLTVENETRRTLLGLIDTSASFNLRDAGTETRLDSALAEISGGGLLGALAEDLDLAFYSFDRSISSLDIDLEAPDLNLTAAGQQTALGNSLRELLNRRRGEALAGIFLTSDGVNTTGESPLDAAAALRDAGIPLYVYGVGSTLVQDLAIESVDVSGTTLVGDAVPVTVRVRSRGMAGKTGRVKLSLAGAAAATEEITFGEDGTSEVSLAFLPNQPGDFELQATVESELEEIHPDNNRWGRQLRVLDSSIRVLMVEQSPRWEFKYIQAMLLREQRVDLDCLLLEADPEITRTPGSPYILAFPQRREDLFAYDLILLGDVDPKSFSNSQIENLSDFVSEAGGSLAVLAGKRFMPDAYRFSPLASLLPVEVRRAGSGDATRPIQLTPTPEGLRDPMLQLEDSREASLARWKKLPPIYWTVQVERAKPAAQVLLADPQSGNPILVLQRYGAGEVLFLGTDNTWRWRKNVGDLYHSTFWGQLVQRLAGTRLLAGSRRSQLRTDRQSYDTGERITVYAKLADTSWDPVREETVRATLTDADGRPREVLLRAVPEQPGQFRAEFSAPEAGRYRLSIASDPDSPIDLSVRPSDAELANPAMDEAVLEQLAAATGGQYFTSETLPTLPAAISNKSATSITQSQANLWASPLAFLLIVLTITSEWVIRKFAELK